MSNDPRHLDNAIADFIDSEILSENEIIDIKYYPFIDNRNYHYFSAMIIYKSRQKQIFSPMAY